MIRLVRPWSESLDALRRRMIHETEAALLYGLRFPDRAPRIPRVEVGRGAFAPAFAARFWAQTLGLDETEPAALDPSDRRRSTSALSGFK
ncbi:MAG: hypothetical protein V1790_07575 [Planctomycetota bacterium]